MIRTQVQIPDELYRQAKDVAARREISMAELVRRGLEYMIAVTPPGEGGTDWELPVAQDLGADDPFSDPEWRVRLHVPQKEFVAEDDEPDGESE